MFVTKKKSQEKKLIEKQSQGMTPQKKIETDLKQAEAK